MIDEFATLYLSIHCEFWQDNFPSIIRENFICNRLEPLFSLSLFFLISFKLTCFQTYFSRFRLEFLCSLTLNLDIFFSSIAKLGRDSYKIVNSNLTNDSYKYPHLHLAKRTYDKNLFTTLLLTFHIDHIINKIFTTRCCSIAFHKNIVLLQF
jgi:hypothetical protein